MNFKKHLYFLLFSFSLFLNFNIFINPALTFAQNFKTLSQGYEPELVKIVDSRLLTRGKDFVELKTSEKSKIYKAFLSYLKSLKLDLNQESHRKAAENIVSRLLNSSTQFLICKPEDWSCLEKKPLLKPRTSWRQDTENNLGAPVNAGSKLDIEAYFTNVWANVGLELIQKKDLPMSELFPLRAQMMKDEIQKLRTPEVESLQEVLAQKLNSDADQSLSIAMYGIDDIKGSMQDVYQAIVSRKEKSIETKAVVDVSSESSPNQFFRNYNLKISKNSDDLPLFEVEMIKPGQINFSYIEPENSNNWFFSAASWQSQIFELGQKLKKQGWSLSSIKDEIFSLEPNFKISSKFINDILWSMGLNTATLEKVKQAVRSSYQYDGTLDLIKTMNAGLTDNNKASVRIEWPARYIMHNKFMILESKNGQKNVWTGTANISRTDMGDELNANMGVYLKNNIIAQEFLNEFDEMYNPSSQTELNLVTGRFHTQKRANTKRYFKFSSGEELRLHFSPTDDGEHRSILPMLMSAQKGDTLRISMFGGSGIELVRALQQAVARGAHVKVALDLLTGSGNTMWAQSTIANLLQNNPYSENPEGSIEVRYSKWFGQNHHKTASLQRANGLTEYLIVGSQNWSAGGNDSNDENMITIRHKNHSISIAEAFNKEFDLRIWPLSEIITPLNVLTASENDLVDP